MIKIHRILAAPQVQILWLPIACLLYTSDAADE